MVLGRRDGADRCRVGDHGCLLWASVNDSSTVGAATPSADRGSCGDWSPYWHGPVRRRMSIQCCYAVGASQCRCGGGLGRRAHRRRPRLHHPGAEHHDLGPRRIRSGRRTGLHRAVGVDRPPPRRRRGRVPPRPPRARHLSRRGQGNVASVARDRRPARAAGLAGGGHRRERVVGSRHVQSAAAVLPRRASALSPLDLGPAGTGSLRLAAQAYGAFDGRPVPATVAGPGPPLRGSTSGWSTCWRGCSSRCCALFVACAVSLVLRLPARRPSSANRSSGSHWPGSGCRSTRCCACSRSWSGASRCGSAP